MQTTKFFTILVHVFEKMDASDNLNELLESPTPKRSRNQGQDALQVIGPSLFHINTLNDLCVFAYPENYQTGMTDSYDIQEDSFKTL